MVARKLVSEVRECYFCIEDSEKHERLIMVVSRVERMSIDFDSITLSWRYCNCPDARIAPISGCNRSMVAR